MADAGLLALTSEAPERTGLDWFGAGPPPPPAAAPELTDEQAAALALIEGDLAAGRGARLLRGVTGSGRSPPPARSAARASSWCRRSP
jgi:primosomal protein N'